MRRSEGPGQASALKHTRKHSLTFPSLLGHSAAPVAQVPAGSLRTPDSMDFILNCFRKPTKLDAATLECQTLDVGRHHRRAAGRRGFAN